MNSDLYFEDGSPKWVEENYKCSKCGEETGSCYMRVQIDKHKIYEPGVWNFCFACMLGVYGIAPKKKVTLKENI